MLTVRVADNLDDLGLATAADLAVETIDEVETASDKFPAPALVTDAVSPEVVVVEWRKGSGRVSDETARGVRVHANEERNKEVVRVPERLEGLLANAVVGGGVHQQHDEQHGVSSDTTSFSVVDLESNLGSNLGALNVEEARAVSCAYCTRSVALT